ncbi:MAG: C25 family cysteine peptidase [Candidatus Amulumruptor caecigallinarius]|nr:C25 family cysteine peptidase [Candidatus Amulumruptor caecigallinarius]
MKPTIIGIISLLGVAATAMAYSTPTYNYQFTADSPLATGKWVKIHLTETGLYEISYDELRAMGFLEPEKVSVFGNGGEMMEYKLTDINGNNTQPETIMQLSAEHNGDRILFYATGIEKFNFKYSLSHRPGYFEHVGKNIYTDKASYFLTDSQPEKRVAAEKSEYYKHESHIDYGFDYVHHERDLQYNNYNWGQVYWGEDLLAQPSTTFEFDTPWGYYTGPLENKMRYDMGAAIPANGKGNLNIYLNKSPRSFSLNKTQTMIFSFSDPNASMQPDRKNVFELKPSNPGVDYLYLDWWVVSYPKSLGHCTPGTEFVAERISVDTPESSTLYTLDVPEGATVWDVSDIHDVKALNVEGALLKFTHNNNISRNLVAFDAAKTHMKILPEYEDVANSNLHALQRENIDMVIVSTPQIRSYAQQIADLHAEYDGMNVVVADPETIYNEFSSGQPDPTGIRLFLKSLYQNETHPLKHVLFMGPIYADYRNIRGMENRQYGLIGFQDPTLKYDMYPALAMDYYGFMADRIESGSSLNDNELQIGVGMLPIHSDEQGAIYVSKVREYLSKQDFSHLVNETTTLSCTGDSHTHDKQQLQLQNLLSQEFFKHLESKPIHSYILPDVIGNDRAAKMFSETLNRGKLLSCYFGHSSYFNLGMFYRTSDFMKLANRDLSFMIFAGCDITWTDKGTDGIGDMSVISSNRALIGSLSSTRTVLSNQNYDLAHYFCMGFFRTKENQLRTSTPSIGEVYAFAKTIVSNDSELRYNLVADPALKIPMALRRVILNIPAGAYHAGDVVTVSGNVLDNTGIPDTGYNGYVTLKLMEPGVKVDYSDKESGMVYEDQQIAQYKGKVTDGYFEVPVRLSALTESFASAEDNKCRLPLFAGTYDPTTRLGGSGYSSVAMATPEDAPNENAGSDEQKPVVTLSYDNSGRTLRINAADETGLLAGTGANGGISLQIDNNPVVITSDRDGNIVTDYENFMSVAHLGEGRHTAFIKATDLAGNESSPYTLQFNVKGIEKMQLEAASSVVVDNIELTLKGEDDGNLTLIVADAEGRVHLSEPASRGNFSCDTSSLPAGVYRASVRSESAAGALIHSNNVVFSKID